MTAALFVAEGPHQMTASRLMPLKTRFDCGMVTDDDIANGLFAETRDEFDKLKSAAPVFGSGDEGRKARTAFVDEHGLDAYLNRNKIEGPAA